MRRLLFLYIVPKGTTFRVKISRRFLADYRLMHKANIKN